MAVDTLGTRKASRVVNPTQQIVSRDIECIGKLLQIVEGWLAHSCLEMGNRRWLKFRALGQLPLVHLAQLTRNSQPVWKKL